MNRNKKILEELEKRFEELKRLKSINEKLLKILQKLENQDIEKRRYKLNLLNKY